MASQE